MPILMAATILGIAGFQYYWLKKAYVREERTLEMRSNFTFRETVHSLQASKLKLDKVLVDSGSSRMIIKAETGKKRPVRIQIGPSSKMIGVVDVLNERLKDSTLANRTIVFSERVQPDSAGSDRRQNFRRRDKLMQFLYDAESPQDSVRVAEIDSLFRKRLLQANVTVPFSIGRLQTAREEDGFNKVTIGFKNPITYTLDLHHTFSFLIRRIMGPIVMSLFLVLFTVISFAILYRNLLKQRKLADIKNEFISNITHELKTPIATVSVAIEALRSFNATLDPARTKEYLDISANELQRLSMLVDKVLKLSMFEKKEIELKYEPLDMMALVNEVTSSMRLQFEKQGAAVSVHTEGDTTLEGDRLHLVSVIFNLVDNALKYSTDNPKIAISVTGVAGRVSLCVADAGIGVPPEYKDRIFEKFFRVPTGNVHNAKGYGLGLSYVAHVVKKHHGTIKVEPNTAGGSKFMVSLPKSNA
ncbi:MAG: histidine kinase [Flaviaesturariibacter sp.]|nr:histidine kinase [Flaviaesturariibacter sp.]